MPRPRADSPPPRMPSPEPQTTLPLSPPPRTRKVSRKPVPTLSQLDQRPSTADADLPPREKRLLSSRSMDGMRDRSKPRSAREPGAQFASRQFLVQEKENTSAPNTPSFPMTPTRPTSIGSASPRRHHRSPSVVVPSRSRSRSPPPSPMMCSPVPPVPPVPAFVLAPTDKKPVIHPQSARPSTTTTHIYLPEFFTASEPGTPRKRRFSARAETITSTFGKAFSMRSPSRDHCTTRVTA